MDSSKITGLLLLSMVLIASADPTHLDCGTCKPPKHKTPKTPKSPTPPIVNPPPIGLPPLVPPIGVPPVTLPPIGVPPVTLPPIIGKPPIGVPPVTLPPIIGKPPIGVPPVTLPPIGIPPVTVPPSTPKTKPNPKPCPPPPAKPEKCPIDTLKLGGCVDLLGGLIHVVLGDPATTECCPVLSGLVEMEAAVCLCTTLKQKLLNLTIYVPIALELLITCGKTPPPGFSCT